MVWNILKTTRRFTWPFVASVGLHTSLVAGLLYASVNRISPPLAIEQPMTVTLVAPEPVAVQTPPPAPPQPVTPPEPQPEPEPVPPPEPEPQPVVEEPPAPVQMPKPKPKPKPKPVHKKEVAKPQPRKVEPPAQPAPPAPARDAPARPATAPSAPAAASTAHQTGPVALSRPEPDYPDRARALGIEGQVKIQFDVTSEGRVDNLRIISATPRNVFERQIREVTRRWRYQSGKPGKDIMMTIKFELSGVSSEHS